MANAELSPTSPGSFNQYCEDTGQSAEDPATVAGYSELLDGYRRDLSEARGISLDELHTGSPEIVE